MEYLHDIFLANLNVVERLGGFFSLGKGGNWENGDHVFEQNKFYYVTGGECSITVEGKTYNAKKGMWFFIPAGTVHKYHNYSNKTMEKYWIHFDLYPDSSLLKSLSLSHYVNVSEDSAVTRLFDEYIKLKRNDSLTDKIEIKALLLRLVSEYIKLSKNSDIKVEKKMEDRIEKVLSYINTNLKKELTNEELAKICFLHPNHFIRFFKQKMGSTPQQYIMQKRMESAKRLIEQTDLNMAEIAEKTGFYDMAHLSKAFKKFYSMAPTQYKVYARREVGR
ncbi:MAG: AraC family transcriptional regulator [Clostridia bacterium]|nr:AraC family transcriptional regulator [Clostridia bacterium]